MLNADALGEGWRTTPGRLVYSGSIIIVHLYMMLYLGPLPMVAVLLHSFALALPCTLPSRVVMLQSSFYIPALLLMRC